MPYIGKQIGIGNYTVLDSLTATTTDTYALTKNSVAVFPQTPANCIVSLNGVIQAPFDSYTISGSNIVFASALTASDSIDFITVLGDVLNVGTVSDGTIGLAKLSATGTKDATTFLRGDNTFASAGANTPAFEAYLSSDQSITDNVETKIQVNTEIYDSDNCYDNSVNYRFTPTTAGKYFVYASIGANVPALSATNQSFCSIRKNGSLYCFNKIDHRSNPGADTSAFVYATIDMNGTTDYLEHFAMIDLTSGTPSIMGNTERATRFGAFKIIE